jgi:hypothetical protein
MRGPLRHEGHARLLLIDRVEVRHERGGGVRADVPGFLPTSAVRPDPPGTGTDGAAGNRPPSQETRDSCEPVRYCVRIPIGLREAQEGS